MADGIKSGIYEIVNLVNGKRYVGSAADIQVRWRGHRSDLTKGKHHSRALQRAWSKYGQASFSFDVLLRCDRIDLIRHEQNHIDLLRPEYNCCRVAGSTMGVKRSPESRAKQSAARKGMILSEAHKAAIGAALKGKAKSPEAIEKTRAARTGVRRRPLSDEHKRAISVSQKGRKLPLDQVESIRRARTGRKRPDMVGNTYGRFVKSDALRRQMSDARKGKPKSPETIERMKAAWQRRKAARAARTESADESRIQSTHGYQGA